MQAAILRTATAAALALASGARFFGQAPSLARRVAKTGSVAALAPVAAPAGAPARIALALGFATAGDFFPSRPGTRALLAGMAAFAAGHPFHAAAFHAAAFLTPGARPPLLPALALSGPGLSTGLWRATHRPASSGHAVLRPWSSPSWGAPRWPCLRRACPVRAGAALVRHFRPLRPSSRARALRARRGPGAADRRPPPPDRLPGRAGADAPGHGARRRPLTLPSGGRKD